MKGEERYLLNLLEGTKTRFVIPVYQRNYDWKIENCKQLFDDLEDVISEGVESHFFGSIVSKADYFTAFATQFQTSLLQCSTVG